ncbi:hypothetical protein [Streptomyces sp. HUAS TT20]|uniref:hypothetical protein n=1 Tax=Streptomyces sp. HUAS TT20 TaxID=3447509 RepID=UPI0021D7ED77|nr:hypothetical protein [Streptomyces sp. HUAS 15-9]UXY26043.1 hypothetical protein N8I87_05265 [Streptomyces sp. HUAS 15-9]
MSAQPPSGPPPGPLHGVPEPGPPPPPPPPPAAGRSWWRGAPARVVAVLAVVVGIVVVFVMESGGGKGGTKQDIGTVASAREVTRRVALTPADWGSGFTRSDHYENEEKSEGVTDPDCNYVTQPIGNALAVLQRGVQKKDNTVFANSTVVVFRNASSAQADVARLRSDVQRCPTEKEAASKARWEGVHEVDVPGLTGFDEVVGEEGHLVADENGRPADAYYTYLTGRKGRYMVRTYVTRGGTPTQNRSDATNALSLMLSRL